MNRIGLVLGTVIGALALTMGSAFADSHGELDAKAKAALASFESKDPSVSEIVGKSAGYVVFPQIQTAAFIVGGATGDGLAYQGGTAVGTAKVTQGTVGLQIGAQVFSQLMVFETEEAFDRFKENKWAWAADATAVATTKGAAAKTAFANGVAVFVTDQDGVMASLSVGGQKYSFTPF